ncbi:unnamed protein product [Colias eurytheme]|nr:unnamed protein product [Colias eurytheme]
MFVGEKNKGIRFTPEDLINHVRSLIKKAQIEAEGMSSNYAWLRSRHLSMSEGTELDKYENAVYKLPPESCAAIAVKLDTLTDGAKTTVSDVIKLFEKLLEEQQTILLLNLVGKKKKASLEKRRASIAFINV